MSLTSLVLRVAAPLPRLERFQRYLFIGPHPDDIEIGAGATAAKLAAAGKQVCFLICTDGRYGLGNAPAGTTPEGLVEIRREEAHRSATLLGVQDLRFLDFSDGGLYAEDALFRAVARVVGNFKPDLIFAPDPDVTSECHVDHRRVGDIARKVACFAPYQELMAAYVADAADVQAIAFYMTAKPDRIVDTRGYLPRQLDAIFSCHVSQFPPQFEGSKALALYLKLRAIDHGLRRLSPSGEGFRVLGQTQMHCIPEAGK
ncbi:MAG: PIG-L family deacetylase [Oscillospiraceae bacterium]|nr:PIG-L family deacetylase [Oscillospiraceae bacterium]